MLKINENNRVNAKDIYSFVDVKTNYWAWLKRCIDYADLQEGKDFISKLVESTGGRPSKVYEFTIEASKEMCIVSATNKAKELRRWLIGLSTQKENLELITVQEAAFAVKVINCLKYIDNQKEAYSMHQKHFVDKNINILDKKYIYSEFAQYRAKITGWDRQKVDNALSDYLQNNFGYNKSKLEKSSMSTKLSVIDIGEAIRISVLDMLYAKDNDIDLANKFSILCKKLAREMQVEAEKTNNTNLFRNKECIEDIKMLTENQK
jgi:phage anti-repressor protein